MDQKDGKVLRDNYVRLVETLETQYVVSYLYQERVLSFDDKEKIQALVTSEEKAVELLDRLKNRKDGLYMLIKALLFSEVQAFLGNILKMVTWSEKKMRQFEREIEGKLDHQQLLETKNAILSGENKELKAKNDEKQKTIKELRHELQRLGTYYTGKNALTKLEVMQLKAKYRDLEDLPHKHRQLEAHMECLSRGKAKNQETIKVLADEIEMLKAEMAALKVENSQLIAVDKMADQQKAKVDQRLLTCPAVRETFDKIGEKVQENNHTLRSLKEEQTQKKMEEVEQANRQQVCVADVMEKQETLKDQREERKSIQVKKTMEGKAHMRLEVHRLGFLA